MKFNHIVLGGTFDRLHAGHLNLIDRALSLSDTITIGITNDRFAKIKSSNVEPYDKRLAEIKKYITSKHKYKKINFIAINDVYGNTLEDTSIDGIVVSKETAKQATSINEKRRKLKMPIMEIIRVNLSKGVDNRIIRSSRIREGLIDRNGLPYISLFSKNKTLYMPDSLRNELRQPLGKLFPNEKSLPSIVKSGGVFKICIGDVVSKTLDENAMHPNISVIDLKTKRMIIEAKKNNTKKILNSHGTLRFRAVKALYKAILDMTSNRKFTKIVIKGEEDLLTLPAILLAPLGCMIFYGLADRGIVMIEVTENTKKFVKSIVSKFK